MECGGIRFNPADPAAADSGEGVALRVLWVLAGLALALTVLLSAPTGILLTMRGQAFALHICLGPLRFQAYPPPKKKKQKKKKTPKEKPKEEPEPPPRRNLLTFRNLRFAFQTLPPVLRRLVVRILRGIRIHPCRVSVDIGGQQDPAAAAQLCAAALTGIWAAMPVAERILRIPDPRLRVGVDFQAEQTSIQGEIGVATRLGSLLGAGLGAVISILSALVRLWQEDQRQRPGKRRKVRRTGVNRKQSLF